jgi:hypothetical protein
MTLHSWYRLSVPAGLLDLYYTQHLKNPNLAQCRLCQFDFLSPLTSGAAAALLNAPGNLLPASSSRRVMLFVGIWTRNHGYQRHVR